MVLNEKKKTHTHTHTHTHTYKEYKQKNAKLNKAITAIQLLSM